MSKIVRLIFSAVLALMLFSGQFCGAAPPMPQYLSDTADLTDLDTAQVSRFYVLFEFPFFLIRIILIFFS